MNGESGPKELTILNEDKKMEETPLMKIVGEAIGEASMCWSETPKGVFDSVKAKELMLRTVHAIEEVFPPKNLDSQGDPK
jgi:hypothetical protein